ncbi:MAG: hypothetical protein ACXWVS_13505 [Hyphomicrobium sp.]
MRERDCVPSTRAFLVYDAARTINYAPAAGPAGTRTSRHGCGTVGESNLKRNVLTVEGDLGDRTDEGDGVADCQVGGHVEVHGR